jgi:hypothetical protein
MIDWRIGPDFEALAEGEWGFPSFEIQEYLLPQINVGKSVIDEYGKTAFTSDECARLKGNIEFLLHSLTLNWKGEIRFDSFEKKGLVTLSCDEIKRCLLKLREAADQAIERGSSLAFFGD